MTLEVIGEGHAHGQKSSRGWLPFPVGARSRWLHKMWLALGRGSAQLPFRAAALTRSARPVPRSYQDRLKRAAKRERLDCLRGRCLRPAVGAISRRRLLACKLAGNAPNDAF